MPKDIVTMGYPALHSPALEVDRKEFNTQELKNIIEEMKKAMGPTKGAAIAAPQIGINKQIIIFGWEKVKNYPGTGPVPFTVLANPGFRPIDPDDKLEMWEHCLSIPGMRGKTIRYNKIEYWGYTPEGNFVTRHAEGVHAMVVQHEIGHLKGELFYQKVKDPRYFGFIKEFEKLGIPLSLRQITPGDYSL